MPQFAAGRNVVGRTERPSPLHVFICIAPLTLATQTLSQTRPCRLFLVLPAAQSYAFLLNTNDHRGRSAKPIPHGAHACRVVSAVHLLIGAPGRPKIRPFTSAASALEFRGHPFGVVRTRLSIRANSGGSHPIQDARVRVPHPLRKRGRVGSGHKGSDDETPNTGYFMRVAMIGSGYVGLVSAAALRFGHTSPASTRMPDRIAGTQGEMPYSSRISTVLSSGTRGRSGSISPACPTGGRGDAVFIRSYNFRAAATSCRPVLRHAAAAEIAGSLDVLR